MWHVLKVSRVGNVPEETPMEQKQVLRCFAKSGSHSPADILQENCPSEAFETASDKKKKF